MGVAVAMASVCGFLQIFFFKKLATLIGLHVAFYFFGVICLLAALYNILVIPETKSRTLEEIYQDLRTKKEKKEDIYLTQL